MSCEVNRLLQLTQDGVIPITYEVPRKVCHPIYHKQNVNICYLVLEVQTCPVTSAFSADCTALIRLLLSLGLLVTFAVKSAYTCMCFHLNTWPLLLGNIGLLFQDYLKSANKKYENFILWWMSKITRNVNMFPQDSKLRLS